MGGDIAAWCALRGLNVTLQDRELKLIEPALTRATRAVRQAPADAGRAQRPPSSGCAPMSTGSGVASADVVIEAIFEDLQAKRALYAAAEPRMPAGAVLASNTSSLTLESLGGDAGGPGPPGRPAFLQSGAADAAGGGGAFPRPPGPRCSRRAMAFTRRIDKLPLPCRSSPGFLVNRVLFPYLHEALHAAGEGIAFDAIDRAAVDFGMPMGPIELSDVVGLDVLLHVGEIVTRELQQESPPYVEHACAQWVQAGKLGRKSGQGFYRWRDGKIARPSPSAAARPRTWPIG